MPVDPTKQRQVLVVHGVQTGTDADLHQDALINELVRSRLGDVPLDFSCQLYRYENLNDEALEPLARLLDLLALCPVGHFVGHLALELAGDVVISLGTGSTAQKIRKGLRDRILEIYDSGHPCYLVAHSLGSIYAFDVLNDLIGRQGLFDRTSRKTWPVQGLLTIGSPIGLKMFRKAKSRQEVEDFGSGNKWFRWLNLWDPNDPVVSGEIFGAHLVGNKIAENYITGSTDQGWVIRDQVLDTGKQWLMAHTAYWHSPVVGDKLVDMVAS